MRIRDHSPAGPEGPDATALLCAFVAVLQAGARFPTNSPRLLDPCRDLLRVLRVQLAQRERLTVRTCAEGLRVGPDGVLFARSLPNVAWVLGRLEAAGLEGIDVTPGTRPELLAELAGALRRAAAPGAPAFEQIWGTGGPGVEVWLRGTAPDVRPFGRPRKEVPAEPRAGRRLGQPRAREPRDAQARPTMPTRSRTLLGAAPRIAPRGSEPQPAPARPATTTVPVGLADRLARETRIRDAMGRIRHRFEREYADRELLDVDEMLGELLRALPPAELARAEAAAMHVARALEQVAAQLEDFLRSGPTRPGEALQELALAQVPASFRSDARTRDAAPAPEPRYADEPEDVASPLVDGFPDSLPSWLDAADGAHAGGELLGAMQRIGEGTFLAGTLRLVTHGELLTPVRVERLLALAGPAAAPIAAVLATQGATWTRGLVVDFLRQHELPHPASELLGLLELADLPPTYLAELCGSLGADTLPEPLSRSSLDLLRRFCEDRAEDPLAQDRRLEVLEIVARCACPGAGDLLEHLSRAGQFVDRSPGARRFRAAAAAALRRHRAGWGRPDGDPA